MPNNSAAPQIEGLVSTPVRSARWGDTEGRTWSYHHPSDCRPDSRRISVLIKADGQDSEVRVIEGDGRRGDFRKLAFKALPAGVSDSHAAAVAAEYATKLKEVPNADEGLEDRLVASMLTAAGFQLDDFEGQEAWQMQSEYQGYTVYVRGAPESTIVEVRGEEIEVTFAGVIHPQKPVEIGISYNHGQERTYCVAASLKEGLRVVIEGKLPYPEHESEPVSFDFTSIMSTPGPTGLRLH
jgi:hypothetical protein